METTLSFDTIRYFYYVEVKAEVSTKDHFPYYLFCKHLFNEVQYNSKRSRISISLDFYFFRLNVSVQNTEVLQTILMKNSRYQLPITSV
jgi:hypothetical protein